MSYRSDCRIIVSKEGFERLKEFSNNYMENVGEKDYDLMEQIEVKKENEDEVYFGWNYLKWYAFSDGFNDVKAIEQGLDWLANHDYSYRFARIGESYDDYEERSFDSDNRECNINLDYPCMERYFNDEVI